MSLEDLNNVLEPIRKKLIYLVITLAVLILSIYPFTSQLIQKIQADQLPENGAKLIYLTPLEGIFLKIKIALILGLVLIIPIIAYLLYQAAKKRFNLPELKKTTIILYIISTLVLFTAGTLYAYELMIPLFLKYLYADASGSGVESLWSIYKFIYFVTSLTLLFGVVFELPLIIMALVKLRLTDIKTLAHYRRHAYVVLFVLAAIITPPDVFSQIVIALPSILLYEIGLIAARVL